jgi:altronate dehydratase large subunit
MRRELSSQVREEVPVSDLVYGLSCGTSDTTSGISANKAVGYCSDQVIDLGGRSILPETTEMLGGEPVLVARAATAAVGDRIWEITKRMEARPCLWRRYTRVSADRRQYSGWLKFN